MRAAVTILCIAVTLMAATLLIQITVLWRLRHVLVQLLMTVGNLIREIDESRSP